MPRTLPPVGFVDPMLPTLVEAAPEGDEWVPLPELLAAEGVIQDV